MHTDDRQFSYDVEARLVVVKAECGGIKVVKVTGEWLSFITHVYHVAGHTYAQKVGTAKPAHFLRIPYTELVEAQNTTVNVRVMS